MFIKTAIIKKLPNGKYRLYSRKKDSSGKRRNLGTYDSLTAVKKREKAIQYFKHHSEDGMTDDHQTKTLGRLSNIATYLEEAGFIDSADKVYMAMDCIDSDLKEDYVLDPFCNKTDEQMNIGGGTGFVSMSPGQGAPSWGMDAAEVIAKMVNLANHFDKIGMYNEADLVDDEMLHVIEEIEKVHKKKETEDTNEDEEEDKQGDEAIARSNGHEGTTVTDNQNSGMFQGFSDSYMYRGYGDLEGAYGPTDR